MMDTDTGLVLCGVFYGSIQILGFFFYFCEKWIGILIATASNPQTALGKHASFSHINSSTHKRGRAFH